MSDFKRECQIKMLKACAQYSETGVWSGEIYYPNCAWDMVEMGLVTPSKEVTLAGRVALFLLGEGEDPLSQSASIYELGGG
ncbi:hypothetical protein [Sulfitobacter mediterraneus]|jgi:hypothetical protein|uniref:hypothetical protein n=1 Tax=Sulfitobacter mediterraneus TaxID=83219 RepID=UPI0021A8AF44|nr:hypothetical protein [Sulfitobacter mediterraneus]UWR10963.1 hypothetical protein K3753_17190 [Sulfitobacter mediterraneus]